MQDLSSLSNAELLARTQVICCDSRQLLVALLAHLGEVEARKAYADAGCSTMLDYCVRLLRLSERAAARRLVVARLARRFPVIFQRIERGELHLTALSLVADLLTEQNHEAILVDMIGKTTRQVEELVACLAPRPDVAETIFEMDPTTVAVAGRREHVKPLSEWNFGIRFNGDRETVELLEEACARMRHTNPDGSYGPVFKRALKALVEELRKTQDGVTDRPQKERPCKPGRVSSATRRTVVERDSGKCAYVAADGTRCGSRAFVQLHHIKARADGGGDGADNLQLLCVTHHALVTEAQFGKERIDEAIAVRQKKKAPSKGHLEGAANSAAEGGGGGGGNSVTASANPNLSSSPGSRPSSGGSAPALRATRGARAAPASPSRRTGS